MCLFPLTKIITVSVIILTRHKGYTVLDGGQVLYPSSQYLK